MTLPDARANKNLEGPGVRARVQRFGGYLAGMIMPNIGAFIAWGLITALFIPAGWWPNATMASLVAPMLYLLLPILIGYTGGRMVHGQRGAVVGSIATVGAVMGGITDWATMSGTPMFLGAMIMGPLAAYLLKLFDGLIEGKVPAGFEMLIDNFSLGILGGILAVIGLLGVGPVLAALILILSGGVNALVAANLLPLASIFVEPAKVLFLNNAINHGIFTPLAAIDVQEHGRSILYMVESNPGAGLGLLTAFLLFGPKAQRPTVPGAIIIHFFGGIHEIFFPYILMKPILLLATIAGSMSGLFVATAMNAGLAAAPAPGSIIAYFLVTPAGGHLAMIATVLTAAVVSFIVASALLNNTLHHKFGQRGVAVICASSHLAAYAVIAAHPPYIVLVFAFILAGFGNGVADAAWNAWVGNLANSSELLGFLHALYGVGGVVSPLMLARGARCGGTRAPRSPPRGAAIVAGCPSSCPPRSPRRSPPSSRTPGSSTPTASTTPTAGWPTRPTRACCAT